ncbi:MULTISPECIES: DUF494 family protein [Legionella]|uniref:DUF494 family protein n=1 Tax=Legionella septentrionalis TaxID=2498109 RepID=A0A433JLE9_9GAMM|nr:MULTISPECIES: DUF494 family protein [Legionella]MCP0913986.1 DUF494 domain-containing protein [Legionella sp. 27cVA30]RUQ90358.1 DUF494 family protein [Legionella septentrionalis]RUR00009.1 DUF494 family protein [Legionella septentrionalis]RUR10705.1 DUF494 family protein [Legionella septentrionalis]RUR16542.1 DUF494 family protein [Legionella septentrionalis]
MKDSLFELLLNLFEKTLSKLKENYLADSERNSAEDSQVDIYSSLASEKGAIVSEFIKPAHTNSMRVFTYDEQMKFTKASYQFLMRMLTWEIIDATTLELIINQLVFSDSSMVTLEETKWAIRNTLAENLDEKQLAFLDLVLYQKKDNSILH